eukprot:Tamp_13993.p1 GENE.Tamp_13993~~Tamp_13993.p1  ORF type:complete len:521 (+),score=49.13 Tamp_13993:182-1564(+)
MEEGDLRTVALNRNPSVHGAQQTGIGIVFGRPEVGPEASGPYKIHSVSSGGTAFQSGLICAGDMLFKVNGVSVLDLTAEQITALILGKPSSPITLTISTPPALHASQPQLPHTSSVHSLAPTPALHSTTPHQLHSTPPANVPMTDDDIGNRPVSPSVAHSYRSTRNTSLWNRSAHGTPVSELRGYMSSSPSLANTSVAGHPSASDSSAPPLYTGYQSHTSATRGMAPISAMSVSRAHTHETPPDTGYTRTVLSPPPMPVAVSTQLADSTSAHKPLTELRFEPTQHAGVSIEQDGKVAVNNGGMYWACLRLTPAVPPTGKYCALFQILRQSSGAARRDEDSQSNAALHEGCGSFIGVCDPERHHPARRRGMGSEHAWMVSLRTGSRFHNGKDLPAPHTSPAPIGSMIAVMIDMDRKLTRIQVDGDLPGATFSGIPDIPGGLLCLAVDLCRGDAIEILPRIS